MAMSSTSPRRFKGVRSTISVRSSSMVRTTPRGEVGGHQAGEVGEGGFGRSVGGEAPVAHAAHGRGDVHDRAAIAIQHAGDGGLAEGEGGGDVEVKGPLEE